MTPRDLDLLRATCLHEEAHLAVARHFGACGFITIRRVTGSTTTWQGRFQLVGDIEDDAWRIVALAGTLAERLDDDRAIDARELASALRRPGALSPCDEALARGFRIDDVRRCLAIVHAMRPMLARDADERVREVLRDYARDGESLWGRAAGSLL